jgi:hypothetical protein
MEDSSRGWQFLSKVLSSSFGIFEGRQAFIPPKSGDVNPSSITLSFQYCLIPLLNLLMYSKISSSSHHTYTSAIFRVVEKHIPTLLPGYLKCLGDMLSVAETSVFD